MGEFDVWGWEDFKTLMTSGDAFQIGIYSIFLKNDDYLLVRIINRYCFPKVTAYLQPWLEKYNIELPH